MTSLMDLPYPQLVMIQKYSLHRSRVLPTALGLKHFTQAALLHRIQPDRSIAFSIWLLMSVSPPSFSIDNWGEL